MTPDPCPWCKSTMIPYEVGPYEHYLRCSNAFKCDASSPSRETIEQAITAWNRVAGQRWRPIETAPMDGRVPILVTRPDHHPRVVHYMVSIEEGDGAWIIARRVGSDPGALVYEAPTHWRPLPDPPEEAP